MSGTKNGSCSISFEAFCSLIQRLKLEILLSDRPPPTRSETARRNSFFGYVVWNLKFKISKSQ
jgi:hypothetical protein